MKIKASELIKWFVKNHSNIVSRMKGCDHNFSSIHQNPYHLEGDVWTHTMMVMKMAEYLNDDTMYDKLYNYLLIAALLHDIGKPEVRNKDIDNKKVSFYSHESVSMFLAVDILNDLEKSFVGLRLDKQLILEAIAMHINIYRLGLDKLEKRLTKNYDLAYLLQKLGEADHKGRFYDLDSYVDRNIEPRSYRARKTDKKVVVMVGLPCSGKSYYIKKNFNKDWVVLSRDEIVMELGKELGLHTYQASWRSIDQNKVDEVFWQRKKEAIASGKNVVVDKTHMSSKSRNRTLNGFDNSYLKEAVVIMTSIDVIKDRNSLRSIEPEGKIIGGQVYDKMIRSFYPPMLDVFDEVNWRFDESI